MRPRRVLIAPLAVLAALAGPAVAQETAKVRPASPREGIEVLEGRLARAVDRVSLASAVRLLGRVDSARGYRLPGYGVVIVLAPRMLPGGEGQVHILRGAVPKPRHARPAPPEAGKEEPEWTDDVETLERQVVVLQQESEAARRAAEEDMEHLVENVRVRVAPPSEVHVEVQAAPEAPEAPPAPPPPAPPLPSAAPEAPLPPVPPPWKFWFETRAPAETRTPEAVVADVRATIVEALAAQASPLAGLAGDERVTVTVDFVPGSFFAAQARPQKTLVVSARVRDMEARARGAIAPEELRKRVEVTEY
ncbi:MAG TPA: hypothetical protein VMT70_05295 [Vicinamibacteria bacterium]|nr:hypothetical protein [Vicinamibacteria bacterium]